MSKNIYLAGAVTGLPAKQVEYKFKRKADELTAQGHRVYNPVSGVWCAGLQDEPWDVIMKGCIQQMLNCDEVHLLPCWQQSRGARLERDIALRLGMPIVHH